VKDPAKEGDKNDQEKDLRDQEEAPRIKFKQESKRLFSQREAAKTNSTNRLNTLSSPVNIVSSSFTTVDPGRERAQRNKFKCMFEQDKVVNGNRIFTPISADGSTYVYLGGSIHKVWRLVDLPKGRHAIGTKWVYRNKKDERGIVVRNKARLVTQGYTQEEGIDYGTIEEEVYVCQPLGFEDLYFPNKVYKVEKALYGLHQAPRAWYETLSTYLLENRFGRGIIDKTLFIKKDKDDILLVQVYVDDIIFGSTKNSLCTKFEGLMHKKFRLVL
nr:hypothetical protein [Tanacetum cinerariifolium]